MFLIDTNVFLEALLDQEKASTVRDFFQNKDLDSIFISDLSLHSIGIILFKLKKFDLFISFIEDMIIDGIQILSLKDVHLKELNIVSRRFDLDFDDSYQYIVAEKYNLKIISFDSDFDNTENKRKEPSEVA